MQTNGISKLDIFRRVQFDQAGLQLQIIYIVAATSAAEDQSLRTVRTLEEASGLFLPQFIHKIFLLELLIVSWFIILLLFLVQIFSYCVKPACIVRFAIFQYEVLQIASVSCLNNRFLVFAPFEHFNLDWRLLVVLFFPVGEHVDVQIASNVFLVCMHEQVKVVKRNLDVFPKRELFFFFTLVKFDSTMKHHGFFIVIREE